MENTRRIGGYEIDLRLFQIRRGGQVIPTERRVFDLIAYLVKHSERVVSSDELLQVLWGGRVVSKASLTVAIAAARKALGDNPTQAQVIITHRGRGYRLSACALSEMPREEEEPSSVLGSFVGREDELETLKSALESAMRPRLHLVSISGEPGIGKSRLAEEFAAIAREEGALIAVGRCREEEGAPSFWPWVQIARQLCQSPVKQDLVTALVDEAPEIASLVPELRSSVASAPTSLPPANARFRLFDGFARFLRHACDGQTLVVILDDIHRADLPSLLLLEFALRELQGLGLLVVATYRPFELERVRLELLSTMSRQATGIVLELEGLKRSEIAKLIRRSTGRTPTLEQARSVEGLTNGNPFFLSQLLPFLSRDSAGGGIVGVLPRTVRDAIARQIDALSPEAIRVLATAAAVGREFDAWLIERAMKCGIDQIVMLLREASTARIVTQREGGNGRWRFSHALVRDVLYQGLRDFERAQLHAEIGIALDQLRSVRSERLPEIAHHLAEAVSVCGASRAIDAACEAAQAASDGLAYEAAAIHYSQALQMAEVHLSASFDRQCTILLRLGAEQLRSGDRDAARQTFERAARIADAIGAADLLAEAALGVAPGFFAVEAGVPDDFLVTLLRRALSSLGEDENEWRTLVMARLGAALFWSEDSEECVELSRRSASLASRSASPLLRLQVILAQWLAEWEPYDVDRRRALAVQAVDLARALESKEALAIALLHRCVGELECGEMGAFDRSSREFQALAQELRQPQALWYSDLLEAARALHAGRFRKAEEMMSQFYEIGRRIGDANASLSKLAQSLVHAVERGGAGEIVAISEEATRRYPVFVGWRASRCWGLALAGERHAANRELDELAGLVEGRVHRRLDWPTSLALMSEASRLLDRADTAAMVRELLLPMKGRMLVLGFCVMTWGPVSRYLGMLAETMGLHSEAEAWYQSAIEESGRSEGEPWLARSEAALARVWKVQGRSSRSVDALRQRAFGRAARLGMVALQRELGG